MIEVEGLVKNYGDTRVVKGIDLKVDEGEIVAFLGPNGAGKTTTIEILEGFRQATAGSIRVFGEEPSLAGSAWRERLGIVLQESEPIPSLTVGETLEMQSNYYSGLGRTLPRPDDLIDLVGLSDVSSQRVRKLSGGQKRRLDLASALVGDPDLIFLDEPTTGFDPGARRESWKMVESLRAMNKTVLLTTHYMDEADHLSDRIVVINQGCIVARGTAKELAEQVQARTAITWSSSVDQIPSLNVSTMTNDMGPQIIADRISGGYHYRLEPLDVNATLRDLLNVAHRESLALVDLEVVKPTLEDVYLKLVSEAKDTSQEAVES